jgi:hypothetical protein
MTASKTIFKRIIDKEIPARIVYEDDLSIAFWDVNPQAPTHILVIPKQEIRSTAELQESDAALAGHLLLTARKIAADFHQLWPRWRPVGRPSAPASPGGSLFGMAPGIRNDDRSRKTIAVSASFERH